MKVTKNIGLSGMMWFDDTKKKTEEQKISEGIEYYHLKYKKVIKQIFININSDFNIKDKEFKDIIIKKVKDVLPDQYWFTTDD